MNYFPWAHWRMEFVGQIPNMNSEEKGVQRITDKICLLGAEAEAAVDINHRRN